MLKKQSVDPRLLYDILQGLKALCVIWSILPQTHHGVSLEVHTPVPRIKCLWFLETRDAKFLLRKTCY